MAWGPGERRVARLGTLGVAVATALVLLVALGAASSGPEELFPGAGSTPERASARTAAPDEPNRAPARTEVRVADEPTTWSVTALLVLVGAVVVLLVGLLVALVVSLWSGLPRWHRRAGPPVLDDGDPLDSVDAVSSAMVADASAQDALLAAGTPRNGIVESWHRFEVQAASAGVPRHPWETSSEFTIRLLDLVAADDAAVARLAALYREARFSTHELGEADREAAGAALQCIHRGLRAPASRGARR